MYDIQLSTRAQKDLRALKKTPQFDRILSSLRVLSENPFPLQSKKLKNYAQADFRLRVGDYRILYSVDPIRRVIVVAGMFHRQSGY